MLAKTNNTPGTKNTNCKELKTLAITSIYEIYVQIATVFSSNLLSSISNKKKPISLVIRNMLLKEMNRNMVNRNPYLRFYSMASTHHLI